MAYRGKPVRDNDNRSPLSDLLHIALNDLLAFIIESARRFIENEDSRIRRKRTGNRNSLALPAGKIGAPRERLLKILQERLDMRQTLVNKEAGTRASLIDAEELLERARTDQAYDNGQLLESAAAVASLNRKLTETVSGFVAEQTQKQADAERKRDRLVQDLVKARSKDERKKFKSPIDGVVQQVGITTIGQVVSQGQPLMTIVPEDGPIEIEALILNRDIGFVEPGQDVVIKIDSFPFTRYGTINGKVTRVTRDAVDEQEFRAQLDTQSASSQGKSAPASVPRGQNLVFPATIQLEKHVISVNQHDMPLIPGMTVTVEIKTSDRRAIDYLLAPIREAVTQSGHER
jgi:hemolysin D